jgi:nicotinamidase-related amidase
VVCVRATVVDAYQRDDGVRIARDCIDSYDEEHHAISEYMDGKLGIAMTNDQLDAELRSRYATNNPAVRNGNYCVVLLDSGS